jgi:hypothetical protein
MTPDRPRFRIGAAHTTERLAIEPLDQGHTEGLFAALDHPHVSQLCAARL